MSVPIAASTAALAFAIFDTPIGACGIAWNATGIAGLQLPSATADRTRARMRQRWPAAVEAVPPSGVQRAIDRVLALLAGEAIDLADIPLDLRDAPDFHRKVYEVARTIPPGQTMTYGEIARRLGAPHESREVGQALGRNPIAIIVPCHRVLGADGRMGGFSASGGVATKRRILEIEGAAALAAGPLFASPQFTGPPRR
jgi:methylated-DNA-[protein]-cysteine S-methyltransferase